MSSPQSNPPKVFISYSHDSREHMNRVLELADRLRDWGVDCHLDQYEMSPPEGWPRWSEEQLKEVDFVLVVCTETYHRRFTGKEEVGKGLGAKWEGAVITNKLYEDEGRNTRFIPVVFSVEDLNHIPERLQAVTRYQLNTDEAFEDLYRRLTDQPRVVKRPLGKLRPMPSVNRHQDFLAVDPQVTVSTQQSFTEDLSNGMTPEMIAVLGGTFLIGPPGIEDNEFVRPRLLTANSSGSGIAAAIAVHDKTDGTQTSEWIANPDGTPRPIDLGPPGEVVVLRLYSTGIRNRSSLSAVTVRIGGVSAEVQYASAQPDFVDLDQINVRVPRTLIGRGEVDLMLTVDGKTANTVRVSIK